MAQPRKTYAAVLYGFGFKLARGSRSACPNCDDVLFEGSVKDAKCFIELYGNHPRRCAEMRLHDGKQFDLSYFFKVSDLETFLAGEQTT